jgi:hypothetical protein
LVTPQFTPSASTNILTFQQRQQFTADWSSTYTVRVSTASQTTHADFTIVDTQVETDFGLVYSAHNVDLSAYDGVPIYVAFVLTNDDGDGWYIDDVDLIANATAPDCASNPTPTDGATGVDVLPSGNVAIAWDAPTTGDAPTAYEIFWGTTSGDLTSLGDLSATSVEITNAQFSTTYYWMVVPKNVGGSATGCAEWSFTTEDAPPPPPNDTLAGAIPITPAAEGTGCNTPGFTIDFDTDGTTDSGLDGTCNADNTGLDQFFTWTATTAGLRFTELDPGGPGIVIRDASGTEITCAQTLADETLLTGWDVGDDLIIQIYDFGPSVSQVNFCLEEYTPPPPIVPTYAETFDSYPPDRWTEAQGSYGSPSGISSTWTSDDFVNDPSGANGTSAKINLYGTTADEYMITPEFNLSGASFYLNFDVGLTVWNSTNASVLGADDYVALLVTEDGGANWTELQRWDSTTTISETGEQNPEIVLTGYGDTVQFAFYAFSDTSNEDNDFFIDNFRILEDTALSNDDETIEGFKLYPRIVQQYLNYSAQENVERISIYNLIGQEVMNVKPNVTSSHLDLSTLRGGIYLVKVQVGNVTQTFKVIKE